MKRFRVKDLMIQALPEQAELQANYYGGWCTWWTCGWTGCGGVTCGPHSRPDLTDWLSPVVFPMEPEELAALKGRLNELLAQVEQHEQRLAERDRPQTLDEVTALEEKLNAALEELKVRKNELSGEAKQ